MNGESYFVISGDDDGESHSVQQFTETELLDYLQNNFGDNLEIQFISKLKDNSEDIFSWGHNDILVIKGKIIVPKPKEVVKSYEL